MQIESGQKKMVVVSPIKDESVKITIWKSLQNTFQLSTLKKNDMLHIKNLSVNKVNGCSGGKVYLNTTISSTIEVLKLTGTYKGQLMCKDK